MNQPVGRTAIPLLLLALLLAGAATAPGAAAAPSAPSRRAPGAAPRQSFAARAPAPPRPIAQPDGTIDVGPVVRDTATPLEARAPGPRIAAAEPISYTVGVTRTFVVLNSVLGRYQLANYQVRLISDTVEVWVQSDLRYRNPDGTVNVIHPDAGDPRQITQARIEAVAAATERIIPTDVEFFGDYASRTGANAQLTDILGLPPGYFGGPGKRVIVLVSNVRDANFYDPVENPNYIIGFFDPTVNAFADRNIITVDSKRWDRNVGPPEFQIEATIAHELQHLINGDQDGDEDTWQDEGLAELAEFINGYRPTPQSHRTRWSDYPENSLVMWGDQDNDPDQTFELVADYQQAYWFMLYLAGRLREAGIGAADEQYLKDVSRLTTDPANGSAAIDAMLERVGAPFDFLAVWEGFRADVLYGGTSDETEWGSYISARPSPSGAPIAPLDLGRLRRNLNFEGYDTPGAPPFGSDYIEIGWSEAITPSTTLAFSGDTAPPATAWRVIPAASTGITPTGAVSGTVLYSGHTDRTDNFLIFPVTVPISGNTTLAFDTLYNIEEGWDFGFTQVTTDTTGATGFVSLPISGTTTISNPQAMPLIKANLPGFTGVSGSEEHPSWVHVEHDLADYAGADILLAFRYSTDTAAAGQISPPPAPGWYLDNVMLGDLALFADEADVPDDALSIQEARGFRTSYLVNLATFADDYGAAITNIYTVTLDAAGSGTFALGELLGDPGFDEPGERVVALISAVPPTPAADLITTSSYASYRLSGLPPSLYTSRARAIGTASNTSLINPSVYPSDTFTVTVTLDNLGRNENLETTGPSPAYVAVPLPGDTSFVAGSLGATVPPTSTTSISATGGITPTGIFTFTENLQALDGGLPAGPGVYWSGTVSDTADLSFELRATQPLSIGTVITPTAHIANAPFGANPSQRFTDIQNGVRVVSPLELSTGVGPATVEVSSTATFTYTLVNTDDRAREVDFRFTVPDGTSLRRLSIRPRDPAAPGPQAADVDLRLSVPSYVETGQVLEITIELFVEESFEGDRLDPQVRLLQPGSDIPYADIPLLTPEGIPLP